MDEQRQAEKILQEIPGLSATLLVRAPYPIVILNQDTSLRYVNPAFEILTGFCGADLVDTKPPFPWWGESLITLGHLEEAFQKKRIHMSEIFRKKNGDPLRVKIDIMFREVHYGIQYYIAYWVDVTEETRRAEDLRSYVREVTKGQDNERKRIAREIHDGTAQKLAMVYTDCCSMIKSKELSGTTVDRLERICIRMKDSLEDLRRLSRNLSPALLDQFGLLPSLELLIEEMNREKGIHCILQVITSAQSVASEVALHLFRITQEALYNVLKHAKSSRVVVSISFTSDKVKLIITDNGTGFNVPEVLGSFAGHGKLGLLSMTERASLLNGTLVIDSKLGTGTNITVEIPRWPGH